MWWGVAISIGIVILFAAALYYLGLVHIKAAWMVMGGTQSLPASWRGSFASMTGLLARNFLVASRYRTLSIDVEVLSGILECQMQSPGRSVFHQWEFGMSTSLQIDISQLKRFHIILKGSAFRGNFSFHVQD